MKFYNNLISLVFSDKCYIPNSQNCFNIFIYLNILDGVKQMKIGTNVIFNGKIYSIRWLYDNGNCEIQRIDGLGEVELVSVDELEILEKIIEYC